MRGSNLICGRIPMFFLRALSLPLDFLAQAFPSDISGRSAVMPLMSLPRRSQLLTERIKTLHLKSNAPYPQPRQKQMRALRPVRGDTKES